MSAHLSEEEQIEALKRWWQRNGRTTLIAVIVGIGAWWGLQQWQQQQQIQKEQNSLYYSEIQLLAEAESLTEQQGADLWTKASSLKTQAEGTQYSWYSALILARLAVEKGDYDSAARELQYVLDGSDNQELASIAQLRLARVETDRGNNDKALQLLLRPVSGQLATAYAELRGDIYMQQGDTGAARAAYQEALNSGDRGQLLTLKLNRAIAASGVADAAAAEAATAEDSEPADPAEADPVESDPAE